MMTTDIFFRDNRLPFVECRHTSNSTRVFKQHMHQAVSVGAILNGHVSYSVEHQQETLKPGQLALINPETIHSCNSISSKERSFYMLYLDVDWCVQMQKSLWHTDSFVPMETIKIDDLDLYNLYCFSMENLLKNKVHLLKKELLLADLVGAVFHKACIPQPERKHGPGDIEQIKNALAGNLKEDLSLDMIAQDLQANPFTLLRQFKAITGITPHAYRMNCRIERAKEFLQQGLDIAETALECGFFDQSHLHRHFKAITTVTPKEYRVNFIQ